MRDALAESKADAVFSNYCFDWRLTEAGKNRVSTQYFEKGLAGAVRTLQRLVRTCRTPFLKNYAGYLKRTGMGRLTRKSPD
jgi:hypothetical protein